MTTVRATTATATAVAATIRPAARLRGDLRLPGDKSISHRALLLATLAAGASRIAGAGDGADVRSTAAIMGALGLVAGLWAEKFDQIAAFQNFVILPMTFLSGVFYSVQSLPPFWQAVSHLNPFFYVIDGFRRGFFGASDASPWLSLGVVAASLALVCALCLQLLRTGYKIRH